MFLSIFFTACTGVNPDMGDDAEDSVATSASAGDSNQEPSFDADEVAALYSLNTIGGETIRILASERSEQDPYFLTGDANFIIARKYLDQTIIKTDTLLLNEYVYTHIDSASIEQDSEGNNAYLLLTVKEIFKGQAITEKTINFILVDINTLEHYTLVYDGLSSVRCYECIDGTFQPAPSLDKRPDIKTILYKYANKSKWLYRPATQAEKDAKHFINYEKKWNADNGEDNHFTNGHSGLPTPIYSTYYKEDIFSLTAEHASITDAVENDYFKIISYFRGNVLGFDKQRQLYFPVFIESCITGCDKKIKFVSSKSIEIKYDEYSGNEVYTVQLDKILFK